MNMQPGSSKSNQIIHCAGGSSGEETKLLSGIVLKNDCLIRQESNIHYSFLLYFSIHHSKVLKIQQLEHEQYVSSLKPKIYRKVLET